MLVRNWLTNQMLLLRHLQMQPATPTTPRRLRCHAAQQPKRHHYESFAPGGLCHHLQSTKAVNLSLSQLQKQTRQWEISKIPESPFGTVNSELSASDPMLLAGEVWPSPPENLRSRRLHWSVSHQTHNKSGLQRISVHTIQNCKISFNHIKDVRFQRVHAVNESSSLHRQRESSNRDTSLDEHVHSEDVERVDMVRARCSRLAVEHCMSTQKETRPSGSPRTWRAL